MAEMGVRLLAAVVAALALNIGAVGAATLNDANTAAMVEALTGQDISALADLDESDEQLLNSALAGLNAPDSGAEDAYLAASSEALIAATSYLRQRCAPDLGFGVQNPCHKRLRVWAEGEVAAGGAAAEPQGSGEFAAYRQRRVTGLLAIEGDLLPGITAGILASRGRGHWQQDAPAVKTSILTSAVLAYLRADFGPALLDAGLGLQQGRNRQTRDLGFDDDGDSDSLNETASARYDSRELMAHLRLELPVAIGPRTQLRPWVGYSHHRRDWDAYQETASIDGAALSVSALSKSVNVARVGGLLRFAPDGADANRLAVTLGYQAAYVMGDAIDQRKVAFASLPDQPWAHQSRAVHGLQHQVSATIGGRLYNAVSLSLSYAGSFSEGSDGLDNRFAARIGVAF